MRAWSCGVPRSGSTLVGQMMRASLPGWEVIATHPNANNFTPNGEPVIASYRDPRDVAASRYRVRLSRAGVTDGSWPDLQSEILWMLECFDSFAAMDWPGVVKIRYEDFWCNHRVVYDAIESTCGVTINADQRRRISNDHNIEANKMRAKSLPDFNMYDSAGVHGDHIATPSPGGWRTVIPEAMHAPMLNMVMPCCRKLGYE